MDETLINKYIGEKIRTLRKEAGLNQSQLADELSIHYKHLGYIENGKKAISISLLAKLCKFFKKEPSFFFDFSYYELNEDDTKLIQSVIRMLKALDCKTRKLLANMIKIAFDMNKDTNS